MKRLMLYISFVVLAGISNAQILSPLGAGIPDAPDKITAHASGIAVAYVDRYGDLNLKQWNGHFWNNILSPQSELTNPISNIEIIDLISVDNTLFLALSSNTDVKRNYILSWNGIQWTNHSNNIISQSKSVDKLIEQDGVIKCIGYFESKNEAYNLISLSNGNWIAEGNLVTKNKETDKFTSIAISKNKVLATGRFTNPLSTLATLAEWDGRNWKISELPPFLGENIALGNYNDDVVVYGKSEFDNESVKVRVNGNWRNMSQGLDKFEVENITQFAEVDQNLIAIGEFIESSTQEIQHLLVYNGETWSQTNLNLSDIEQLYSYNDEVFVSGDFSDNARISGIGAIYLDRAQITALVFNDKNGDCVKNDNENWLEFYPISSKSSDLSFYTDQNGQLYLPAVKENYSLNAKEFKHYQPTCPDINIEVDEYKTYYGAALGVKKELNVTDVGVNITDQSSYSSQIGESKTSVVCLDNLGSLFASNASLVIKLGEGVTDFSSDLPYLYFTNNTVGYDIDLDADESLCFNISYTIEDIDNSDVSAIISLSNQDADIENNFSEIKYKKGETLPNNKHCANGKLINPGTKEVTYKISFLNQANRPAYGVKIVDYLDPSLLISSGGIAYTTSHNQNAFTDVELLLTDDNVYRHKVITTLQDIELEALSEDESLSNGFVEYDINIRPLVKGSTICNTASVFFDYGNGTYGEPLNTNEVCSEVGEVLSTDDTKTSGTAIEEIISNLEIGPNPASNYLFLNNGGNQVFNVVIFNSLGQEAGSMELKPHTDNTLDISSYSPGIYMIYSNGLFAKKFVVH
jgi:hypothetical protein